MSPFTQQGAVLPHTGKCDVQYKDGQLHSVQAVSVCLLLQLSRKLNCV